MARMMTQAEYARHRGVSRQAINKAVGLGRLVLIDGRIDADAADASYDPLREPEGMTSPPSAAMPADAVSAAVPLVFAADKTSPLGAAGAAPSDLTQARTAEIFFRSERSRLDLEARAGKLVEKAQVDAAAFEVARDMRDRLLRLPGEVAPSLAGLADERQIEVRLSRAIRAFLEGSADIVEAVEAEGDDGDDIDPAEPEPEPVMAENAA